MTWVVLAQRLNVSFKCQDIELVGSPLTATTVLRAVTPQPEFLCKYKTDSTFMLPRVREHWPARNDSSLTPTEVSLLSSLVISEKYTRCEVVKTVVSKISVLYDMMPCTLVRRQIFKCNLTYSFLGVKFWRQLHNYSICMYVVGSKSFRPDIQKPRQMENAVRDM